MAGHETTAALLTWTLFELVKARGERGAAYLDKAREEVWALSVVVLVGVVRVGCIVEG